MTGSFKNKGGTAENIRPLRPGTAVRDSFAFQRLFRKEKERK